MCIRDRDSIFHSEPSTLESKIFINYYALYYYVCKNKGSVNKYCKGKTVEQVISFWGYGMEALFMGEQK